LNSISLIEGVGNLVKGGFKNPGYDYPGTLGSKNPRPNFREHPGVTQKFKRQLML
jgi:hypothetical protein